MSYYFDYDDYIEKMNKKGFKAAKPDKRRKKIKNKAL